MANQIQIPGKRELLESLLEQGMVMVRLNSNAEGVNVPPQLRNDEQLGLNLSYRFQGPLFIHDEGIEATLSFAGVPYACTLPFSAVYALVSHHSGAGYFFPEDAPESALLELAEEADEPEGTTKGGATGSPQKLPPAALSTAARTTPSSHELQRSQRLRRELYRGGSKQQGPGQGAPGGRSEAPRLQLVQSAPLSSEQGKKLSQPAAAKDSPPAEEPASTDSKTASSGGRSHLRLIK